MRWDGSALLVTVLLVESEWTINQTRGISQGGFGVGRNLLFEIIVEEGCVDG